MLMYFLVNKKKFPIPKKALLTCLKLWKLKLLWSAVRVAKVEDNYIWHWRLLESMQNVKVIQFLLCENIHQSINMCISCY